MTMTERFDKINKRLDEIKEKILEVETGIYYTDADFDDDAIYLEHSTKFFRSHQTHNQSQCAGERCTIHNRSNHHMRSFPQKWSDYKMWRVCPHDVIHPDPDEINKAVIHDCDTCCYLKEDIND